ncbi:hypothetical protein P9D74_13935 [Bacillus vallismortis]|uniref:hypothetical protein n=1 Tax=Bacillus vallismortis TaxID=72361 RepID=UPI002DB763B7|nr:hypothetical protein [Bacillus vallismortis]MEC1652033.1 hypothetical protein [Bacillus vallismortis]
MKFKKTLVSLLSVTVLALSANGVVSAKEPSMTQKTENNVQDFKTLATSVATWGWPSSVTLGSKSITTLDTFSFGKGTSFSIDGYQESGSAGTPTVVYSLYEKKSGGKSSAVWSGKSSANGYVYLSIPASAIDSSKTYILEAENTSSVTVKLRGNAFTSS